MSQNQEIVEAKLCAYIDGVLDADGRAEIERHLKANPQHRRLLESLRATRDLIRFLPRESAPLDLTEALHGQLERAVLLDDPIESLRPSIWPRVLAAAAIVVLTVGLGAAVFYALPQSTRPQIALSHKSSELADNELALKDAPAAAPSMSPVPFDSVSPDAPVANKKPSDSKAELPEAGQAGPDHTLGLVPSVPSGRADMLKESVAVTAPSELSKSLAADEAKSVEIPAQAQPTAPISSLATNGLSPVTPNNITAGVTRSLSSQQDLQLLANDVSQNSGDYFSNNDALMTANGSSNQTQANSTTEAQVMLVRSDTPDRAERELTSFLQSRRISWRQPVLQQAAKEQQGITASPVATATVVAQTDATQAARQSLDELLQKRANATVRLNDRLPTATPASPTPRPVPQPSSTQQVYAVAPGGYGGGAQQNAAMGTQMRVKDDRSREWASRDAAALNNSVTANYNRFGAGGVYVCQMSRRQIAELKNSIRVGNEDASVADVPRRNALDLQGQVRAVVREKQLELQPASGGISTTQPINDSMISRNAPQGAGAVAAAHPSIGDSRTLSAATHVPSVPSAATKIADKDAVLATIPTTQAASTASASPDDPVWVVIRVAGSANPPVAPSTAPATQPDLPK